MSIVTDNAKLRIKKGFNLEYLNKYGFSLKGSEYVRYNPNNKNEELCVDKNTRNVYIWEYQFNYYGLTTDKNYIKRIASDLVDLLEDIR